MFHPNDFLPSHYKKREYIQTNKKYDGTLFLIGFAITGRPFTAYVRYESYFAGWKNRITPLSLRAGDVSLAFQRQFETASLSRIWRSITALHIPCG
jgi:hypothetical protein